MIRGSYNPPFDCQICGGRILFLEPYDYCGVCCEPIHQGCGEFRGHKDGWGWVCPECGDEEDVV